MVSLNISMKTPAKQTIKNFIIKLDAHKFERLAAHFGFFNSKFIDSISAAEKDYRAGRVKKIKSLKNLAG